SHPRGGKSRAATREPVPVIAENRSESHGLGAAVGVAPLGLGEPLPWDAFHPNAPVTALVDSHTPTAESLSAFERVPTSIGRRSLAHPQSVPAVQAAIHGATGPASPSPPPAEPPPADARKPSAVATFIRDRLSPDGVSEI